ncbi:lysozyme [Stutzerimonas stutzeri]|uniref:lysozyme n=1 Tax=Stutzerimonas stutzeri TaxID=316 RepID=UPI00244C46AF|nr:lysozyme [Stutzerimonas stutzeri]MDH0157376.1 lysozyme [Stutzerimonas stutzeri]
MHISEAGLALIRQSEGLRLRAYLCPAGIPTIGYGSTAGVKLGQTITAERAEELLREDVRQFEAAVSRLVKVPLTQGQFDALTSFAFNLGTKSLEQSTLLRLLNAGDYPGAAAQFDRWVYASGKKLTGLVKRRAAERALFEGETPCA